jgi:hypothetical protein
MAWTSDDLAALESAMKKGATRVKYKDSEIEYRSLSDMQSLRNQMRRELGLASKKRRVSPSYSKGLDSCD